MIKRKLTTALIIAFIATLVGIFMMNTNRDSAKTFSFKTSSLASFLGLSKNKPNSLLKKIENRPHNEAEFFVLEEIFEIDKNLSTRNLTVEIDELNELLNQNTDLQKSVQIKSILWDILVETSHQKNNIAKENNTALKILLTRVFPSDSSEVLGLKKSNPNSPVFDYLQNKEIL